MPSRRTIIVTSSLPSTALRERLQKLVPGEHDWIVEEVPSPFALRPYRVHFDDIAKAEAAFERLEAAGLWSVVLTNERGISLDRFVPPSIRHPQYVIYIASDATLQKTACDVEEVLGVVKWASHPLRDMWSVETIYHLGLGKVGGSLRIHAPSGPRRIKLSLSSHWDDAVYLEGARRIFERLDEVGRWAVQLVEEGEEVIPSAITPTFC